MGAADNRFSDSEIGMYFFRSSRNLISDSEKPRFYTSLRGFRTGGSFRVQGDLLLGAVSAFFTSSPRCR